MDLESGLLERLKRKERGTAKPGGDHWFPCGVKLKGSSSDSDVTHSLTDRLQLSDEEANDDSFVSDSAVQNVIPDTPSPVFAKRKNCALLHRKSSQEPPGKRVKKLRNQLPSIPKHRQPSSDSEFNDMEKTEDRIAAARAKALQLLKKKRDKMQTKGVTVSHGCDSGSEGATLSEAQRKSSENSSDSDLEPFDAGTFHSRNPRQAKIIALKNDSVSDESSSDLDEKEWEEYMKRLGKIKTSPRAKQNGENSGSGDSSPSLISGSPVKYHKRKSVTKRKRSTEQTGGQNDTNIKDALLFPDEEESSTKKKKVPTATLR